MKTDRTIHLQLCIDRLRDGNDAARAELIEAACDRLRSLAHHMMRGNRLRRWEETDDVLQKTLVRLHNALATVQPETVRDFLRLAAWHIRLVLIDLARHYYRPTGLATNHQSNDPGQLGIALTDVARGDQTPSQIISQAERWNQLHTEIQRLPDDEREVVELIWFHGLTQMEAATIAGIAERTVHRRWVRARLKLFDVLEDALPGE